MENIYSNIDPIYPCPNMWQGRDGHAIKAVVIHKPEGEMPGVKDYLMNPETQKSYHFIISYDGTITQLVNPDNSAWHCGGPEGATWPGLIPDVNPNYYTIGISLEGFAAQPHTERQFPYFRWLAFFPQTPETIGYHHDIRADKACPGLILNKAAVIACVERLVEAGNYVGWPAEGAAK